MHRLALAALVLSLAGCGGSAAPEPPGTMVLVEESGPGLPMWMEGSVGFARIEDGDGRVVYETPPRDGATAYPRELVRRELPAGTYRITSWQRPCQGNCGLLDPPTARCEGEVELPPDATVRVTVEVADPCRLSSARAAAPTPAGG